MKTPGSSSKMRFSSKMKSSVDGLLKNQIVLYVVSFIAFVHVLGYLAKQNSEAVIFFLIVGFLTTYFSKNMIVVLLSAIIATNMFIVSRMTLRYREGMTDKADAKATDAVDAIKANKASKDADTDADADEDEDARRPHDGEKEPVGASHKMGVKKQKALSKKSKFDATEGLAMPASEEEEDGDEEYAAVPTLNGKSSHIDYSKTLESAYGNLEQILGEGGMKDISSTTQQLMEQQKMLMENMHQMKPMMKMAEGFLDKVGGGAGGDGLSKLIGGLFGNQPTK